jgi:carbonic anhydrase/acetyltransferase-like protein (isoleucine patch superfamily)
VNNSVLYRSNIGENTVIGNNISIFFAELGINCTIGANSYIYDQSVIGNNVTIGNNVHIWNNCIIEDNCTIPAFAEIGVGAWIKQGNMGIVVQKGKTLGTSYYCSRSNRSVINIKSNNSNSAWFYYSTDLENDKGDSYIITKNNEKNFTNAVNHEKSIVYYTLKNYCNYNFPNL